jgi:hypothetical protein
MILNKSIVAAVENTSKYSVVPVSSSAKTGFERIAIVDDVGGDDVMLVWLGLFFTLAACNLDKIIPLNFNLNHLQSADKIEFVSVQPSQEVRVSYPSITPLDISFDPVLIVSCPSK